MEGVRNRGKVTPKEPKGEDGLSGTRVVPSLSLYESGVRRSEIEELRSMTDLPSYRTEDLTVGHGRDMRAQPEELMLKILLVIVLLKYSMFDILLLNLRLRPKLNKSSNQNHLPHYRL